MPDTPAFEVALRLARALDRAAIPYAIGGAIAWPKDRVDLEKLLAVQGRQLDASYVRRRVVEMMGEGDERVAEWDQLTARYWT